MTNDYHAHLTDDVRRALEEADEAYRLAHPQKTEPLHIYERDDLDNLPEQVPLIKGVVPRHGITMLSGTRGLGKSLMALDWAGCIGHPKVEEWHGFEVAATGPVLYVAHEGWYGFRERVAAWETQYGHRMEGVGFITDPINLRDSVAALALAQRVRDRGAIAIILDSARSHGTGDEGSGDMSAFVRGLETVRTVSDAAVIVLHNAILDGERERGHGSFADACDATVHIKGKPTTERQVYHRKFRDGRLIEEGLPHRVRFVAHYNEASGETSGVLAPVTVVLSATQRLLEAVRRTPNMSTRYLANEASVARGTASKLLKQLRIEGKVENRGTEKDPHWWAVGASDMLNFEGDTDGDT